MDIRARLMGLAGNLYWTWHRDAISIFRDLNPELWRQSNHNPIELLNRLSNTELEEKTSVMALESRIARAHHILRDYVSARDTWASRYAGTLTVKPVAYFSAEFGLHESLPIYSGGLGVLSGDHMKAASDLGVAVVGVGLLYLKGYFRQSLDSHGRQHEHEVPANPESLPLRPVQDEHGRRRIVVVRTRSGPEIRIQGWEALVGRCRLVLLDTNVQENSPENRELTAQLYGGDSRIRIRQELVLGVGGMRMLRAMGVVPGVVHMNEGHSAFALLEQTRMLMDRDGQDFENVREMAASMGVFTTHTPVPAGHDRFDPALMEECLGPLRDQLGLSTHDFLALGRANPGDAHEPFCMTILGLHMSRARNAVSFIHRRVTRSMWRQVWPDRREEDIPIAFITNGVHTCSWLAPEMHQLYDRYLGEGWEGRLYDPKVWAPVDRINDEELWETSEIVRAHMIDFVGRRVRRQCAARGEPDPAADHGLLAPAALTIGFARRFAPYKRAALILRDLDRLDRLVNNPAGPVQLIFAGKAHPADEEGKALIQEISRVSREPRFAGKLVFIEDYDINVARHLVQGVNLWVNLPRRPLEACGTSGMKVILNGGLVLSVLDGWWEQAYDGTNGFVVDGRSEHSDWARQDAADWEAAMTALEGEVVPMFNRRDGGVPHEWIHRQKNALRTLAWSFSAERMVSDYVRHCYLPAAGGTTSSFCGAGNAPNG
jgi:starch phosphorylase